MGNISRIFKRYDSFFVSISEAFWTHDICSYLIFGINYSISIDNRILNS